jgi:ketosteroid isomerase-like protein
MSDETTEILKTFQDYTDTFKQKNALALLPFYEFPALIVDRDEKPKVLSNPMIAAIGLHLTIQKLVKQGYACSKLHALEAKQVRYNLAIVGGTATRHKENGDELDKFGFTYTLRKSSKGWKIVAGVIHDQ